MVDATVKEVQFAVSQNQLEALEQRVLYLEKSREHMDKKIDGLKKVCKLQQEFFSNWELEYIDLKDKITKGIIKNQQL